MIFANSQVNQFAPHFAPDRFSPKWVYEAMVDAASRHPGGRLPAEANATAI
jgi:hypothetical protein